MFHGLQRKAEGGGLAQRPQDEDERIDEALANAGLGKRGTPERFKWLALLAQINTQAAKKEQRRTVTIGIVSSILVTVLTTLLTWATGMLQWLLSFSTARH
jgi:hypothetical protein